jgi:hypothetical protein
VVIAAALRDEDDMKSIGAGCCCVILVVMVLALAIQEEDELYTSVYDESASVHDVSECEPSLLRTKDRTSYHCPH